MAVIQLKEEEKHSERPATVDQKNERLMDSVRHALKNYFRQLKGEEPSEVYPMVLTEIEVPLLEVVMKQTKNNQSLTARMLGLSRGTTRQKLKKYGLLERSPQKMSK
jgi:Fis family transcriptional regulator